MHDCWDLRKWVCVLRAAEELMRQREGDLAFLCSPPSLLWLLTSSWWSGCSLITGERPGSAWLTAASSAREQGSAVPPCVLNSLSQRMRSAQVPGPNWGSQKAAPSLTAVGLSRGVFPGTPGESNTFSVQDTFLPFLREATSYDNTELKLQMLHLLTKSQNPGGWKLLVHPSVKSMNLLSSFNSLYWVWQSLFCHSVLL